MRKLILRSNLSPGDIVVMTATVRDLHAAHPGKFLTDVRTPCPALWEHNPHITPIPDGEGEELHLHYPIIHQSNQGRHHFLDGYRLDLAAKLGIDIPPGPFKGDIHLSEQERSWLPQVEGGYWIIVSGGKTDFTAKWWDPERWQQVVKHFAGQIRFVQVGEAGHKHPPLRGVIDLRGKTDLRQLARLVYHADGVLCPVTSLMHLAAAVPTKSGNLRPCVVVAGGREPSQWEAYPGHRYLDAIGSLPCCANGGCWKSRVVPLGDGDKKDESLCAHPVQSGDVVIPRCLDLITAADAIRAVKSYSPEPKPTTAMPCCPPVVKNGLKAAGRALKALATGEQVLISKEETSARLKVCVACDRFRQATRVTGPRCEECGCFVKVKARLATERCPLGKWPGDDALPKVGLVIGTFAALPYIHLQLEAARRLYPHIPILVHDDGSPQRAALAALCAQYGADFVAAGERNAQFLGDLSVYRAGIQWAQKKGVDYLVKLSRRWIWKMDWTPSFLSLVGESDADTVSHHCLANGFGFRTECVGFKVSAWRDLPGFVEERIAAGKEVFVEYEIHRLAEASARNGSEKWKAWDAGNAAAPDRRGYAPWPLMGDSRHTAVESHLWHNCASHRDYATLAAEWDLPYSAADFSDPNHGCGDGYARGTKHLPIAESRLLLTHAGLGDMLTNCGLVVALQGRWKGNVILPVPDRNLETARFLYRDNPNIIPVPMRWGWQETAESEISSAAQLCSDLGLSPEISEDWLGGSGQFYCVGHRELNRHWHSGRSVDQAMYAHAQVPERRRFDGFCLRRDREKEEALFRQVVGNSGPYVFVHDDASRGYGIDVLSDRPIIRNRPEWPIHYLGLVLERAAAIHCFDSSIRCLIEGPCFDLSNVKLFWNRCRGTVTHFTRHAWTFT